MRSTTVLNFLFASATIAAPILEGVLPVGLPDLPTGSLPGLDSLDITKDLDLDSLTSIVPAVPELPVRRGLLSGLDVTKSLPLDTSSLPLDTSSLPLDSLPLDSLPLDSLPLDLSDLPLSTSSLPVDAASVPVNTTDIPDTSSLTSAVPVDPSTLTSALPVDLPIKRLLGLTGTVKTVNDLLNDVLSLSDKVEADLLSLVGHLEDANAPGVLADVYNVLNAVVAKLHTILAAQDADIDLSPVQPIVSTVTKEANKLAAEFQSLIDAGLVGEIVAEIKSVIQDVITLVENVSGDNL